MDMKGFSSRFREEKWIPPFLNRGSGVSESWGGLVFHMALLNGEDWAWWPLEGSAHAALTLVNRAFNQCGEDKHHPLGLLHADMGRGGAEVPSALAAAHGGMCGRFQRRAAERQPGLPHRHQQGVRRRQTRGVCTLEMFLREFAQVYLSKHGRPREVPPPLPLVCAHPSLAVIQDTCQ